MKDKLRFLKVTESNINDLTQGISELHFEVYKRKFDLEYWQWRYLSSPAGKSNLIVAVRGTRVVGKYGLLYIPLIIRGQSVVAGLMSGLSIQSEERSWQCYRGLIMKSIDESKEDNLVFRLGLVYRRLIKLAQRMGIASLGSLPVYFGFLDIARILEERSVPRLFSRLGCLADPILGLKKKGKKMSGLSIKAIDSFGSDFDDLWDSITKDYRVAVLKNAAYLNWRYIKNPLRKYGCLGAYRNNRLEGIVVFCAIELRHSGCVLELLVRNNNPEVMRELLFQTFRQLRKQDVGCITASFPKDSITVAVLQNLGFRSWGRKLADAELMITANYLENSYSKLDLKICDFSLGDWIEH